MVFHVDSMISLKAACCNYEAFSYEKPGDHEFQLHQENILSIWKLQLNAAHIIIAMVIITMTAIVIVVEVVTVTSETA